jgi:signal transduction histidine kinase
MPGRGPVSGFTADPLAAREARAISRRLLDAVSARLELDLYVQYLVTEDGSALRLESCSGVAEETAGRMARVAPDATIDGAVASRRASIVAEDIQRSDDARAARIRALGIQAYVCHPLVTGDHLVGTLAFGTRRRARFEPGELQLLQAVAEQVALAVEHERLVGNLDRMHRRQPGEDWAAIRASEQAARAEAEEANRARDEFLAVLSHQLRTPLNVMYGWVRMLQSPGLDPVQAAHALKIIERNVRAQTDLINDLLDVSRIVSGTLVLDMRPLDLFPVVEAAIEAVRPSAEAKGVTVQAALGSWPLKTVGDGARLRQVATNLLTNAVKFTPTGGAVAVRLERAPHRVRLIVSDTGEGIPPASLPHIFDRYRPRDRRSRTVHGGLGLGLTLVRRLVELHGGTIEATSAGPRRGAIFTVDLPLRSPDREDRDIGVADAAPLEEGRLDLIRILVVDDDADTRDLLSVILKERGATVVTAESVATAYRLLAGFGPDVVLCDIAMPGEDGFRLLDWVKERERRQGRPIPVVALTAHARSEDRYRIMSAGFKGYLPKPLESSDIVSLVRSVTGRPPRA